MNYGKGNASLESLTLSSHAACKTRNTVVWIEDACHASLEYLPRCTMGSLMDGWMDGQTAKP